MNLTKPQHNYNNMWGEILTPVLSLLQRRARFSPQVSCQTQQSLNKCLPIGNLLLHLNNFRCNLYSAEIRVIIFQPFLHTAMTLEGPGLFPLQFWRWKSQSQVLCNMGVMPFWNLILRWFIPWSAPGCRTGNGGKISNTWFDGLTWLCLGAA